MNRRLLVLTVCLVAAKGYLLNAERAEPTPIRQSLTSFPLTLGDWRGRVEPAFPREVLDVLGVDDYTMRRYVRPDGAAVSFYVGYHSSQRQGDTIHSPMNCLPGAGWTPTHQSRVHLFAPNSSTRSFEVNRVLIEKGLDRQLVLYWYQSHGRIIASEYWGKFYTVVDAIRLNRTDAALVRVIAPVIAPGQAGVEHAEAQARDFVRTALPLLGRHLPS
jgi:EpsI family protein